MGHISLRLCTRIQLHSQERTADLLCPVVKGLVSHLAIVLVHTMGYIQDPVHLHVVWIEWLLILKRTTGSVQIPYVESYTIAKAV